MSEQRFLVVRLGSLGDIVHTFPAVAALRESFPNAEIVWLTHPRWKLLVESSWLATEVWAMETRSCRLACAKSSAAFGKRRSTPRSTIRDCGSPPRFLFSAAYRARIGFSSETIREYGVPILYTDRVRSHQTHIADQNGELSHRAGAHQVNRLRELERATARRSQSSRTLQACGIDRYVALSPGGGWRSKCWPPERFGALCKKIRRFTWTALHRQLRPRRRSSGRRRARRQRRCRSDSL